MRSSRYLFAGLAGAMILSAPASAQTAPDAEQARETASDPGSEVVCRREPPPAGTRLGARRVCRTAAEWDLIARDGREMLDRVQSRSTAGNN